MNGKDIKKSKFVILFCVMVISSCGMGYELLAGTITSYFLGNSVLQFSITIGLFLFAMGIGSFISGKIEQNEIEIFAAAELILSVVGGSFSLTLFTAYTFTPANFYGIFIFLIMLTGTIIGLEIPLLIRMLKRYGTTNIAVANVLSLDYLGALAASILFPLVILPLLGLMHTSFLFGILNITATLLFIRLFKNEITQSKRYFALACMISILLCAGFLTSANSVNFFERHLFTREIILTKQTKYQKIVMTKRRDDVRLFLDGHLQFCSQDEYRYHETLVHPALSAVTSKSNILVLGGGDGLAVREILKYQEVKNITLVDIDKDMVSICQNNPIITTLNKNALRDPRLQIQINDAFKFIEESNEIYDVIFIDLPDPNSESLAKLYSIQFYRMIMDRLSAYGIVITQATSPFFAPDTFWCIFNTIKASGLKPEPMYVNVPSFGEWGFIIAGKFNYDYKNIHIKVPVKYVTDEQLQSIFTLPEDISHRQTKLNSLNDPAIIHYYHKSWENL